ncbi:MAG TPA: hybrid sensor histidine kinase/response regulator transcription factor, partial [Arenibacter sp.]|nr:hybrid sensor histidine kinase/response regulator transcription factor [Arenibacter sp.]
RSATYTNLDAGNYIFKLKAANNDGLWNVSPLNLHITVLPPWWKTNWALFSYVSLFILGIYLLNKLTQNRIREKQLINSEREKRMQEKDLAEKKFQFFTSISHEFRTPLTLIINPLRDIINDTGLNLPSRIKEKHHVIYKNTDRLYRLVNELLDFRKLELNKIGVKAREFNLTELLEEVVGHFKEEAFEENIHLSLDADKEGQLIWTDENMLEKIIFNILSNAFKVTPEGGAINIQLLSKDSLYQLPLVDPINPTEGIELIISDTGPGLEKEQVDRLFERFYQVENLDKSYYGGTGIGLEVVQNFMNLLKGKIEVKSEVGSGTSFRLIFPKGNAHFKREELLTEILEHDTIRETITTLDSVSGMEKILDHDQAPNSYTLLIVEDNSELRNYLRNELKDQYRVLMAANGVEGLEVAKTALPDIILTDVIMPGMDGFEFCKHIKGDIRTSHIPLMMLTAKARIDDRLEGIGTGADAYMVKPFDMRLLRLRLSQLITSRQLIFNKYFSVISDLPSHGNTTSLDKEFIEKVLNYINKNMDDPDLSVESLASQLNLSRSQFYRKIKALTNQTANEFLRNIRLNRAKQLLEKGNSTISEVCFNVGFSSPSYFTKCFKAYFGVLPTEVMPMEP